MSGSQRIRSVCLSIVALLVLQVAIAAGSAVEELAKRLPDNTMGFMASSGGDALKGDFDKSTLGRLWNDPNLRTFSASIWSQVQTRIAREADGADVAKYMNMALEYASLFAGRPFVVGVAQIDVKKEPPVCVFAIIEGGDRKTQLADAMAKLEAQFGKDKVVETERASLKVHSLKDNNDVPVYWGWAGNYLVIAVNDSQDTALKSVSKPRVSAPDYFKNVPGTDDAVAVHYDFRRLGQFIQSIMAASGGPEDPNEIAKVLTQLGLGTVRGLSARMGFSGMDLVSEELVEVPEPRAGLLTAFKPVDLSLLGLVDPNAMQASVVNCDLAAIYDTVVNTIKTVSPDEGYPELQKGLAEQESETKINIRKDLLGTLAGPAVLYSLPAGKTVEAPMGGSVGVVKVKDAALFEKTMVTLGKYIGAKSEGMLQITDQNDGGRTIHIWTLAPLALMQLMPTWSVVGDNVIFGSNSALHQIELSYVTSGARRPKSLLDTEGYKKVAAQLPKNLAMFSYVDSQAQFSQMMMGIQQVWPMAVMMAAKEGVTLPVMLPNLNRIVKEIRPGCQYAWFAPDGLHVHYQGTGIEPGIGGVAGGALAMGIMMPALARTRQLAFRMTSGANLSGIGKACLLYANDHDDKLPPDLETLIKEAEVSPKSLESKNKPKDFEGPSFVYIPGQTTSMRPDNIIAYENPEFCVDGVNVLFLDSHVEFMKPEQFREQLAETYKRLGRPAPTVRFKDEPKPVPPSGPSVRASL